MRALFLFIAGGAIAFASTMQIVDLGSLGGSSSVGFQISNTGVIVGYSQTATGDTHAFSYSNGTLTDLNGSSSESYAYGSNSGAVVGTSYLNGQAHGTVWTSAQTTDLGAGTYALAINSSGEIAGGNGQAVIFDGTQTESLGYLPGGTWSSAYAINDAGVVAGYGNIGGGAFRGFIWSPNGMQVLGTLGGNNSYATAINQQGEVVGHSSVRSGYEHAFAMIGGQMVDLGTLGGGNSYAYGINDGGAIVGYSYITGNDSTHAFAYSNGQMTDLNTLLPAGSGWVLTEAYGIDNSGNIVGTGMLNGQSHAFLLDPPQFAAAIPEPATVGLMLAGIGALVALQRRKH